MDKPYRVPTRNVVIAASGSVVFIVLSVVAARAFAIGELPTEDRAAGWTWFAGAWLVAMAAGLIAMIPSLRRGTAFARSAEEQAQIRAWNLDAMRPYLGVGVAAGMVLALFMTPSFWAVVCGVVAGLFAFVLVMTLLARFFTSGQRSNADHPGPE